MFNKNPVSNHGSPDPRYTITLETSGYSEPRFVARFRGERIGHSTFYGPAVVMAVGHNARRNGALVVEEVIA